MNTLELGDGCHCVSPEYAVESDRYNSEFDIEALSLRMRR